jgi:uncharacterized protein (TIGR02246 family)
MRIRTLSHNRLLPVLVLLGAIAPFQLPAQDAPSPPSASSSEPEIEQTIKSLGQAAERFVAAFNGRDAAAVAALFTPDGEIVGINGDVLNGRREIEDYHLALFARQTAPRIALEATAVRLPAPGLAIEDGQLHLTTADDEPVRTLTYQTSHVRQADGTWLVAASRSLAEVTAPAERIKPLHWLIGEWTLEREDGVRIDMGIDLDDRGNNLLGEALITNAGEVAQLTKLRIGWNPATSSVYWWTCDSGGGNASGPWARRGEDWIVHSAGVTADAEATASSQTLVRDGDSMVWLATHRVLAGEALPDLTYRFVRRAPETLSVLESQDAGNPGSDEE